MSALLRRRRRAAAVLAALLALALAADAVLKAERPGVAHEAAALAADGWDARGLLAFGEGEGAAGDANDAGAVEPLPEGFAEEVMPLDGYADVRVGAEGAVVGFTANAEPARAFEEVRRALCERGWTSVPSGSDAGGSFVKRAGPRTWAYVACVRTGETTSVVVQCAAIDGKGRA